MTAEQSFFSHGARAVQTAFQGSVEAWTEGSCAVSAGWGRKVNASSILKEMRALPKSSQGLSYIKAITLPPLSLEKWGRGWALFKMSQEGGWIACKAQAGEETQDADLVRGL